MHQVKAIQLMQKVSKHRREKSTRRTIEAEQAMRAELRLSGAAAGQASALSSGGGADAAGSALGSGGVAALARARGQGTAEGAPSAVDSDGVGSSVLRVGTGELKIRDGRSREREREDERIGVRRMPVQGIPPLRLGERGPPKRASAGTGVPAQQKGVWPNYPPKM